MMKPVYLILSLMILAGFLVAAFPALAQTGDEYELSWWTVAGGGGTSQEGDYALTGSIGQPNTDLLGSDEFTLVGGFFSGEAAVDPEEGSIYLPLILHE
jgi:hypothetical protein